MAEFNSWYTKLKIKRPILSLEPVGAGQHLPDILRTVPLQPLLLHGIWETTQLLSFLQVIALADAVEENQDNLFQSFTKLRSATQLVILLIGLWQKLSPDQVAILEAAFLPLQQDTQELGWEETVDAAISHLLKTCLSKSSKEQALNLSSQLNIPKDTSRLKKHITLLCDRLAKGGRLCLSTDAAAPQTMVLPGGCTTIPESDLEERSIEQDSAELFTNHKHLIVETPMPEVSPLQGVSE
ncbi:protein PTHB1-like [Leptonychotes weddellii]|uniref:Protein PTHB1-like n=1 Tax=Leptonychotes weddellii TaxID=9713 RepID=A0A2U3XBT2_LEPWE|nr:protein PTHB1-like [Leptonychotes weddellii]